MTGALTVKPTLEAAFFYVSAIDGPNRHLVAGPYSAHAQALNAVRFVRNYAEQRDYGRACWMAWGTASSATPLRTPLGVDWTPALEELLR